ncbi:glyoxalase superfamily protein [Cellulomonas aerilata]|uniref:Bleomycin resistance protein n=1 Tax=Cellulomonas aerilata TaxID=515326 RepID=A0A512D860_9CELL|nr:glyoxalase superfamily protein [Cellulomonas aerilata]GEO32674.1 glyoxalase [Cellulomonas aerilata]
MIPSTTTAKAQARRLRQDLGATGVPVGHARALELVAHLHGVRDWNTFVALASDAAAPDVPAAGPTAGPGVPVLRVRSAAVAVPFYVSYLGFTLDWEHRFEPGLPLYVQVSRSALVLHLSEHHGDGSGPTVVWVPVVDVHGLQAELRARTDVPLRPGIDLDAPGGPTMEVVDPDGNVLRFAQRVPS